MSRRGQAERKTKIGLLRPFVFALTPTSLLALPLNLSLPRPALATVDDGAPTTREIQLKSSRFHSGSVLPQETNEDARFDDGRRRRRSRSFRSFRSFRNWRGDGRHRAKDERRKGTRQEVETQGRSQDPIPHPWIPPLASDARTLLTVCMLLSGSL
jgi:hypothetical protein